MHTVTHIDAMNVPTILARILEVKNWNQAELAKRLGVRQPQISRWLNGAEPRGENEKKLSQLARQLEIIKYDSEQDGSVQVVGYIGAGGGVIYAEGQGPFGEAKMPPRSVSATLVAVEVRGDSMAPLLDDGSIIYYDHRSKPTEAHLGRLCVVGLSDGRVLIKRLLAGRKPGLYDLYSLATMPLTDQAVEWAAKVVFIGFP